MLSLDNVVSEKSSPPFCARVRRLAVDGGEPGEIEWAVEPKRDGVALSARSRNGRPVRGRSEWRLRDYVTEITRGGFPGMRRLPGRALNRQLDSYIDRIVDHDLIEVGVRRPEAVRTSLRAYAAATGTTATWETIRDATTPGVADKPARATAQMYRETLILMRVLDPMDGWLPTNNQSTSTTSAPKHYLCEPALAARLVRLSASRLIDGAEPDVTIPRDGTFLGALFESLVALSVRTLAQLYDGRVYHLRTRGGRREVDYIVETDEGVVGIEAKLASHINDDDTSHLLWLRERLREDCIDLMVVNAGPQAFRTRQGVAVVPLAARPLIS